MNAKQNESRLHTRKTSQFHAAHKTTTIKVHKKYKIKETQKVCMDVNIKEYVCVSVLMFFTRYIRRYFVILKIYNCNTLK